MFDNFAQPRHQTKTRSNFGVLSLLLKIKDFDQWFFFIRSIRNFFPFPFSVKPLPPFYLKLILIKIGIRREQGTVKFVTQACHLSSFATSLSVFNIYIQRAQLGRVYSLENKIIK